MTLAAHKANSCTYMNLEFSKDSRHTFFLGLRRLGLKSSWLKSLGLESSWLKSLGLKGPGLKLGVEKSGVEMSFNRFIQSINSWLPGDKVN